MRGLFILKNITLRSIKKIKKLKIIMRKTWVNDKPQVNASKDYTKIMREGSKNEKNRSPKEELRKKWNRSNTPFNLHYILEAKKVDQWEILAISTLIKWNLLNEINKSYSNISLKITKISKKVKELSYLKVLKI